MVNAARPAPRNYRALIACWSIALLSLNGAGAAWATADQAEESRQYLELSPATKMDLEVLLDTLEASIDEVPDSEEPVVIILHGREASVFTNQNYSANKRLVDQAARLDAEMLIDVRMCATWMARNALTATDIPDFIDTVPFAPEEIRRLKREGYERFDPIDI